MVSNEASVSTITPHRCNSNVAFKSTSKSSHQSSLTSVEQLWGGMQGKIYVVHSAWNKNRVLNEMVKNLGKDDTVIGKQLSELNIEDKEQIDKVIDTVTKYGSLVVEGDLFAMNHVLSILNCLYPPESIRLINAWDLGQDPEELKQQQSFKNIVSNNVILLCGPSGNLVTEVFLNKSGLTWLFPEEPEKKYSLRIKPDDEELLGPDGEPPHTLRSDYGVFLRRANPFNSEKRVYALMGAYAFGTQGAAVLACSEKSAEQILQTDVDPALHSQGLHYIAWVKIWKKENETLTCFSDPEVMYRLQHPKPKGKASEWKPFRNPTSLHETVSILKAVLQERTVFLGSRPTSLLIYSLWLACSVLTVLMLVARLAKPTYIAPLLILTLIGTVRSLFKTLHVPKKHQRAYKE